MRLFCKKYLVTFQSWLGAGWPEWAAETSDEDPTEFNSELSRLFAILRRVYKLNLKTDRIIVYNLKSIICRIILKPSLSFCSMGINFLVGSIVDLSRKIFASPSRPSKGTGTFIK